MIPGFAEILLAHLPSDHMSEFKTKLEKFVSILKEFLSHEGAELTPELYNKVLVACQLENARGPFGDDWRDHRRSYKYLGTTTAGNYTSGTWILLHFLSIHAKSEEDFNTMTTFWGTFFPCEGCCTHFLKMVKEEINCHSPNDTNVIKFWKLHNLVNERLAKDRGQDESFQGKPKKFPKRQFPEHIDFKCIGTIECYLTQVYDGQNWT